MNKWAKTMTRVVAGALAALLLATALLSGLSFFVSAATADAEISKIKSTAGSTVSRLNYDSKYTIEFSFTDSNPTIAGVTGASGLIFNSKNTEDYSLNNFWSKSGSSLSLELRDNPSNNTWTIDGVLKDVTYKSNNKGDSLEITIKNPLSRTGGGTLKTSENITITIPSSYFTSGSGNSGGDDTPISYSSKILVENAVAIDSSGKRIDAVTKDTPSFTVDITFADVGLQHANRDDLEDGDFYAYFTGGAFEIAGGTARGTLQYLKNSNDDYPRFRATFKNVTYSGSGKDFSFQAFYLFDEVDDIVQGEGTARVYAAKGDTEDEKEEDEMALPVPKIIISSYSYGEETIVAGNEFTLNFTLTNTSELLPLENIVITMTPTSNEAQTKGPGLIVASSSNTIYVPSLTAGASQSFSIAFQARPDAEVTSHLIQIAFSYEYVDTNQKKREKVDNLSESVAIPVSQVDRFEVSPIMGSVYGVPGEEAYLTINFVNKGKSATNNVSATVKIDPSISAPSQHYGHVEPGKSDYLDIYLTPSQPGEYSGEVIVQYEDENSNVKEISTPFSIYVEDPAQWYPPQDDEMIPPDMNMEQQEGGGNTFRIVMCVIGGIAIAVPIALYLMKRVKAKGSEDFDEAF